MAQIFGSGMGAPVVIEEHSVAHTCTAANRRYLGQRESNGYCYSLFRNNLEFVGKLMSPPNCRSTKMLGNPADYTPFTVGPMYFSAPSELQTLLIPD